MPKPDFALDRRRRAGERPGTTADAAPDAVLREVSELVQVTSATVRSLLAGCKPDEPLVGGLESIQAATDRLESACARLNAVAMRPDAAPAPTDINALANGMLAMLRRLAGPFITLDLALSPGAFWVTATRVQLEQLILNLVMHARDALPLGGTVRVTTRRLMLAEPRTFTRGVLAAGDWTLIEVRDSGPAADHDRSHLFESAFAGPNHVLGGGTDLGAARLMAERVGGCLVLDVALRTGAAAITICLPSALPRRERRALRGSPQAILVVDADEWTRTSAAHLLRRAGYGVLMASHPTEALELLHDVAGRCVRLVLADAALAGPGPQSLATALGRERPGLPVIAMVSPTMSGPHGVPGIESPTVMKPLQSAQLLQAIRLRFGVDGGAGHLAPAHAVLLNSPR